MIATIALFFYGDNIPGNGEMYDAWVAFFSVDCLIFCEI